jgi:hypothetical protein
MLFTSVNSLAARLLITAVVASCAAGAQDLTIGSVIHLQNKFSGGGRDHFLDTQGRVQDQHAGKAKTHKLFVFTNDNKDRDKGSGRWKIGSADGSKKDGAPLAYGDKITLQNMHANAGYLDEGDDMWNDEYGALFKRRGREQNDYPAFTAERADDPSEYWIVGGRPNVKKGSTVKAGDWLTLESVAHPGYLLRAGFLANESARFRGYKTRCLVFTSTGHFGQGEQFWIPLLAQ